jgi:hypothetical protein
MRGVADYGLVGRLVLLARGLTDHEADQRRRRLLCTDLLPADVHRQVGSKLSPRIDDHARWVARATVSRCIASEKLAVTGEKDHRGDLLGAGTEADQLYWRAFDGD